MSQNPPSSSLQAGGDREQGSLTITPGETGETGPSGPSASSGLIVPAAPARSVPYAASDRGTGPALQYLMHSDSENSVASQRRSKSRRLKLEMQVAVSKAELVKQKAKSS